MDKCTCCGKQTNKTVYDIGMNDDVPLCDNCKETRFEKCKICGQHFYKEDLENGVCEGCQGEL